jgi:hypothetical protein
MQYSSCSNSSTVLVLEYVLYIQISWTRVQYSTPTRVMYKYRSGVVGHAFFVWGSGDKARCVLCEHDRSCFGKVLHIGQGRFYSVASFQGDGRPLYLYYIY